MQHYLFFHLFYFLKADKKHYRINVFGMNVSVCDGLGTKVPS